ncbi:Pyrrolidone-carboxylate peptidase [Klebsiella variicola subsp. tropica]|nr:Pyrrolidone-carboxylate peptidase [Klebsiella variicola subsp. tropica]
MAGVLLTGFEPFDGETVNPSWEVVKLLDGMMIAGQPVIARQLPCVFGEALSVLYAAIEDLQPRLVIAVGQAGGRVDISVERVAINVDDARIPDNNGQQPVDTPIVDGGRRRGSAPYRSKRSSARCAIVGSRLRSPKPPAPSSAIT